MDEVEGTDIRVVGSNERDFIIPIWTTDASSPAKFWVLIDYPVTPDAKMIRSISYYYNKPERGTQEILLNYPGCGLGNSLILGLAKTELTHKFSNLGVLTHRPCVPLNPWTLFLVS